MTRANRVVGQLLFVALVLAAFAIVIESGAWLVALALVVVAWLIATIVDRR
jgi:uncharacterized membrane protein